MSGFQAGAGVAIRQRRSKLKNLLSRQVCGDIAAIITLATVMLAAWVSSFVPGVYGDQNIYVSAGLLAGLAVSILYNFGDLYQFDQLLSYRRSFRGVIWRWGAALMVMAAAAYMAGLSENFSRRWFLAFAITGTLGLAGMRAGMTALFHQLAADGGVLNRRLAIVGATDIAEAFIRKMKDGQKGISISGIYDDRSVGRETGVGLTVKGNVENLIRDALAGGIDDIVICLPWSADTRIDALLGRLSVVPVSTVVSPDLLWLTHNTGDVSRLGGIPLLRVHRRPLEGWGSILKSVEDRVIAALLLVLAAPVLVAIAILIKLDSKGPVLFAQKRHGFSNDVFKIYKFRTMTVMEDGAKVTQAKRHDKRITRLGAGLRRSSLDELPQLFNVLKGDMSLVGPRPHAVAHNEEYAQKIQHYAGRHKVKPGITGWAQVNGLRGETAEDFMMENRVKYDLNYIENWSIFLDIKILFMTIWAVILPKNAY